MCLSTPALVGLSYGFFFSVAQIYELFRAADARAALRLDGARFSRIAAFSLALAFPIAGAVLFADRWLASDVRRCMSVGGFVAMILAVSAAGTFSSMAVGQIHKDSGLDVMGRAGWRVRLLGLGLGFAASWVIIFGGHFWWREGADHGSSRQGPAFGAMHRRVDSGSHS